jgi:hypothetical protein
MELPKVKKKRSDVSKRIEGNKDTDFVCIKMSWNSLCKNNYLKQGIQEIVYNINKISFLSYKLLNFIKIQNYFYKTKLLQFRWFIYVE